MPMDPLHTTALESLDFGDVLSPDGRAHPVTANTAVYPIIDPGTAQQPTVTAPASNPVGTVGSWLTTSFFTDNHIGARAVVGILAIGILLIVVFRLTK